MLKRVGQKRLMVFTKLQNRYFFLKLKCQNKLNIAIKQKIVLICF